MSGCDYLDNIKGIGFGRVVKALFLNGEKSDGIKNMVNQALDKNKALEYFHNVELSKYSFRHQLVVDVDSDFEPKKLVHLNKLPSKNPKISEKESEMYIGKQFTNFINYTKGERMLNDETKKIPPEETNFNKLLKFFGYTPKPSFGCISNLTQKTINYETLSDFYSMIADSEEQSQFFEEINNEKKEAIERKQMLIEKRTKKMDAVITNETMCPSSPAQSIQNVLPKERIKKIKKAKKLSKKLFNLASKESKGKRMSARIRSSKARVY